MFTTISINLRTLGIAAVLVAVLLGGMMSPRPAAAQSTEELQALINSLMAQVALLSERLEELRAGSSSEGGFDKDISVGDTVQTTDTLKVRGSAAVSAGLLGTVPAFTSGQVIDGPETNDGYVWWYVRYNTGMTGWSAENWMRNLSTSTLPVPTPEPDEVTVSVNFLSESTEVNYNDDSTSDDDSGVFEIDVDVTAVEGDVYVPQGDYSNAPNSGFTYDVVDSSGDRLGVSYRDIDSGSLYISSTADEDTFGLYTIAEGETETFTIRVTIDPVAAAFYRVELDGIRYYTDDDVDTADFEFMSLDRPEFKTDYVFIDGDSESVASSSLSLNEFWIPNKNFAVELEAGANYEIVTEFWVEFVDGDADMEWLDITLDNFTGLRPSDVFETLSLWYEGDRVTEVTVNTSNLVRLDDIDERLASADDVEFVLAASVRPDAPESRWDVGFAGLRYGDTAGNFIIDSTTDDLGSSIDLLVTEEAVPEVTVRTSALDPDDSVFILEDGEESDYFLVYALTLESNVDNMEVNELVLDFDIDQPYSVDDIVVEMELEADGYLFDDYYISGDLVIFDIDGDLVLDESDRVEVELHVVFDEGDDISNGTQFDVSFERLEAESYDDARVIGSAQGEQHTLLTSLGGTSGVSGGGGGGSSATPPEANYFSCDRTAAYGTGNIACYGMWDYGNSFGGDENMCGSYGMGVNTGCVIDASACQSGSAIATQYYSNRDLGSLSSSNLATIASNLETTSAVAEEEIAGLWEYTCN